MNLYEKLNENHVELLWRYLRAYGTYNSDVIDRDRMSYFLRFWSENKRPLYNMFKENLILQKQVMFQRSQEELRNEMKEVLSWTAKPIIKEFTDLFQDKMSIIFGSDGSDWFVRKLVFDAQTLVNNMYDYDSLIIPGKYTVNGRPFQINHGAKAVKIVGKIAKAIGLEVKKPVCTCCGRLEPKVDENGKCLWCGGKLEVQDGYEEFRKAHSMVLNQKKVTGTLCLSIHPMDYVTMSDNNCGWSSCMQWMNEAGDYRLGTIEMMNSPCVVVAYLSSSDTMWTLGGEWNSKKWRQLYIVTPKMILGNRQYPYDNDDLEGACIKWLRELATQTIGFGPYAEETCKIHNHDWNVINGDTNVYFDLYTGYMYNDVYDYRLAYVSKDWDNDERYNLCFSGPAVCTVCGNEIEEGTVSAHNVVCPNCDDSWQCDCCGGWHDANDFQYTVNGYHYCEWCYDNDLIVCECCGERHYNTNPFYLNINTDNDYIKSYFNFHFCVELCDECFNNECYLKDFGPKSTVRNDWGYLKNVFDISNITNEGLNEYGSLSYRDIEFIKAMRDAESDEVRIELIKKRLS